MKTALHSLPVTRAERTSWAMNNVLIPAHMVTLVSEVDATELESLRQRIKTGTQLAPSFTALVIKAAAITMRANPDANRAILGLPFFKKLYQFNQQNISVAVEKSLPYLPGQAYAAPLDNVIGKSLLQITDELKNLATCNESNNKEYALFMRILKKFPTWLSLFLINMPYWVPSLWEKHRGCAAWVNAPSRYGADLVMTTWPWPITFSFGVAKNRPTVVDGQVVTRFTMPIVMVFDRRIMGGGPAGRIFSQFKEILETANFNS